MRKAVLLTCLTLCHARASLVEASTAAKATCTTGQKGVARVREPGDLTVNCPDSLTLNPKSSKVFSTEACNEGPVDLESLVPGATLKTETNDVQNSPVLNGAPSQSPKYTFTVVQMPPAAVSVFYLCKKAVSPGSPDTDQDKNQVQTKKAGVAVEERCTIEIQIAAANPLGPNTCAVEGGRINLDLRAVNETARFSCSQEAELIPTSATKAYDSTCAQEVDLPQGLARRQQNSEYCLDLKELPKQAQHLCYLCKTAEQNKLQIKGCQVHVRTAAGASRAGARGTTALRLALLAVICLYIN